jgi:hypothetical protein
MTPKSLLIPENVSLSANSAPPKTRLVSVKINVVVLTSVLLAPVQPSPMAGSQQTNGG